MTFHWKSVQGSSIVLNKGEKHATLVKEFISCFFLSLSFCLSPSFLFTRVHSWLVFHFSYSKWCKNFVQQLAFFIFLAKTIKTQCHKCQAYRNKILSVGFCDLLAGIEASLLTSALTDPRTQCIDVPDFFFRGGQTDPLEFRNFFSGGSLGGPGGKQGVNWILGGRGSPRGSF